MDQKELRELESKCIQEHPPACTATCPIHVDVRSFLGELSQGNFDAAYRILKKTIPFPGIISRICDHPCQHTCKRKEAGEAVSIAALAKTCVQLTSGIGIAKVTTLPLKNQKVAVIGSGLSGLTAAYDLAKKGYQVTVFEARDYSGGKIREIPEVDLPPAVINEDLSALDKLGIVVILNTTIGVDRSLASVCQEYDAVYLGVGTADQYFNILPDDLGNLKIDPVTFTTSQVGVFAGGTLRASDGTYSPIGSVSDGRRAAISIDRYLQGVSLSASRENEGSLTTRLYTSTRGVKPLPVVPMDNGNAYTIQAAIQEASRCIQCQCLECVKVCNYLAHYGGYPKRYIREIYNNESIVKGIHHANKMINSCSLCGLCQEVCPQGLNMGEIIKSARQRMVQKGKMPSSTHDFPLRDMEFNNSDHFALTKNQPETESSRYLFFPGCQLSASSPDKVEKVYDYLRARLSGGVGLMLRCCGAPAEWSGRSDLVDSGLQLLKSQWTELGKPQVIVACSSCYYVFKNHLPEMPIVSLWELFTTIGLPVLPKKKEHKAIAIHDACTTRHETQIHDSVRTILQQLGYPVEELPLNRELARCCGYGGLMSFANPELAEDVTESIVGDSSRDYVTYCAMCRDRFAAKGKPTLHVLDLIYDDENNQLAQRKGPGYSQRHENRARLKNKLLQEVWGEKVTEQRESIELIISDEVQEIMEQRLILLEDIQNVIQFAETTGKKMYNPKTGHYLAYYQPVSVTYWVEYSPLRESIVIHNAYCHRMEIVEEVKS